MRAQLQTLSKKGVSNVIWIIENTLELVSWIWKGLFYRKLMFHSLFISVLINAASVFCFKKIE